MTVSQTLRDQWKVQILAILKAIEDTFTGHPDIQNREAELARGYDREHSATLALIIEAEVLSSQARDLEKRRDQILHDLRGSEHLDNRHAYHACDARATYDRQRHEAVLKRLGEAIAEHPKLAEEYARYKEVADNLDLTLLLCNTPTRLKEAMVRLCTSLGVDLPAV